MKIASSLLTFLLAFSCSTPSPKTETAAAPAAPAAPAHPETKHVDFYSIQNEWPGACQHGTAPDERQSPIALADALFAKSKTEALKTNYKTSDADIVDNGHSVVVQFKGDAGSIEFEGKTYELKQFHFHKTSEHTLNGKVYDMEVHFVHLTKDKPVKAIALGFFVEQGKLPKAWEKFWAAVPQHVGPETVVGEGNSPVVVANIVKLNPRDLIPKSKYLTYEGSLTTPPCDEFVTHLVSTKPIRFTAETINKFAEYHEVSNRAIQPLGDAKIRKYRVVQEK